MWILSDKDKEALEELLNFHRQQRLNAPSRTPVVTEDTTTSPDIYVVLTPSSGIPAVFGSVPGSADCQIFRLIPSSTGELELEAVESSNKTVYNIYSSAAPANAWIITVKDKYGNWFIPLPGAAYEESGGGWTDVTIQQVSKVCTYSSSGYVTGIIVEYTPVTYTQNGAVVGTPYCVLNPDDCCLENGTGTSGGQCNVPEFSTLPDVLKATVINKTGDYVCMPDSFLFNRSSPFQWDSVDLYPYCSGVTSDPNYNPNAPEFFTLVCDGAGNLVMTSNLPSACGGGTAHYAIEGWSINPPYLEYEWPGLGGTSGGATPCLSGSFDIIITAP